VGGAASQSLLKLHKDAEGQITQEVMAPVVFVPCFPGW
jgi:protein-L-isoaspartate(D-aspartate) O-methyltransferase